MEATAPQPQREEEQQQQRQQGRVVYRLLAPAEYERLREVLGPLGGHTPTPDEQALVAVAELDGEIIGTVSLVMAACMENFVISEEFKGRVHFARLVDVVNRVMPQGSGYYAHPTSARVEVMCERTGMVSMPNMRVMVRHF